VGVVEEVELIIIAGVGDDVELGEGGDKEGWAAVVQKTVEETDGVDITQTLSGAVEEKISSPVQFCEAKEV
jgi:hypothetical protein